MLSRTTGSAASRAPLSSLSSSRTARRIASRWGDARDPARFARPVVSPRGHAERHRARPPNHPDRSARAYERHVS